MNILFHHKTIRAVSIIWITLICQASPGTQNDLSELGFEIFVNDPNAPLSPEKDKKNGQAKIDNLPDFIDPETWLEDLELDKPVDAPPPKPKWEPIYSTIELNSIDASECCLRAARSSRYEAEDACLAQGKKVWHITSFEPELSNQAPETKLGFCHVFINKMNTPNENSAILSSTGKIAHTNQKDLKDIGQKEKHTDISEIPPGAHFRCLARAMAECYSD